MAYVFVVLIALSATQIEDDTITRQRGVTFASTFNCCRPLKNRMSTCLRIFQQTEPLLSSTKVVRAVLS